MSALLAVLVTTVAVPSRADPSRASLVVTRDDGSRECPESGALLRRVEVVAGKSLFASDENEPRDTWVQVEFVRSISGFRAMISAHGSRQGTRALDDVGPDCTSLAEAVAITLAILLDPAAAGSEPIPAPPVLSPQGPATAPLVDSAPATLPLDSEPKPAWGTSEAKRSTLAFGVEAAAGASLGVLDGIAPLVEGGGRARIGEEFAVGMGAGYVLPDRAPFGEGSVGLSLTQGYVRACANLLPKRPFLLEACLETMLGGLRGEGHDYDSHDSEWVFWSAAAALFQVYGRFGDTAFWSLRARVLAPLARHGFNVIQDGSAKQAFQLSAIGGTLSFGVEAEL